MSQVELKKLLIDLGFILSKKENTREIYIYQNMIVGIINGTDARGVSISNNRNVVVNMYDSSDFSVNHWAYKEAYTHVAYMKFLLDLGI